MSIVHLEQSDLVRIKVGIPIVQRHFDQSRNS